MISIIVPNFNHVQFLPQRLDTIFNQTFQDFEVILLDDFSTDGSWDFLKQFENHPKVSHCIRNDVNSGSPFKQWKKGINLAKHEWIWIAESDDFSDLHFLEIMFPLLSSDVFIAFSSSNEVDELGQQYFNPYKNFSDTGYKLLESSFIMKGKTFIHKWLRYKNYIDNASSAVFRKPKNFPIQSLEMRYSGDWFFWIYLLNDNYKIAYTNKKLNFFRYHDSTTRIFVDNKKEFEKKIERFSCISFSQEVVGLKFLAVVNFSEYDEDVKNYFHLTHKFGRLKIRAFFPRIPFFLYPQYYVFFINSLLPKKLRWL